VAEDESRSGKIATERKKGESSKYSFAKLPEGANRGHMAKHMSKCLL